MNYEDGNALDDMPLAAYGGSGMELTAEDEARIELAADTPPVAETRDGEAEMLVDDAPTLDLADEPGEQAGMPLSAALVGLGGQVVTLLRTSRLAAGVAFGGVILVGLALLAGGGPKPGAASVQPSLPITPAAVATQEPGNATLVLTGKVNATVAFAAMSGSGTPGAPLAATWSDGDGPQTLGIAGAADRGTRSTDETLVLSFTVTVKSKPVTFTSDAGECTIGMAVNPTNVFGTFSCKNLKSDDGKLVVGATGTYRT